MSANLHFSKPAFFPWSDEFFPRTSRPFLQEPDCMKRGYPYSTLAYYLGLGDDKAYGIPATAADPSHGTNARPITPLRFVRSAGRHCWGVVRQESREENCQIGLSARYPWRWVALRSRPDILAILGSLLWLALVECLAVVLFHYVEITQMKLPETLICIACLFTLGTYYVTNRYHHLSFKCHSSYAA